MKAFERFLFFWSKSAAAPATCGAAMLVPDFLQYVSGRQADLTSAPGATRSGLMYVPKSSPLEKESAEKSSPTAPTAITSSFLAGDVTPMKPKQLGAGVGPQFPLATTTTTPLLRAKSMALYGFRGDELDILEGALDRAIRALV